MMVHFERDPDRRELALKLQLPEAGPTTVELSVAPQRLVIHSIEAGSRRPLATASARTADQAAASDFEIALPMDVDPDSTRANICDGVLDLRFEISASQSGQGVFEVPVTEAAGGIESRPVRIGIS